MTGLSHSAAGPICTLQHPFLHYRRPACAQVTGIYRERVLKGAVHSTSAPRRTMTEIAEAQIKALKHLPENSSIFRFNAFASRSPADHRAFCARPAQKTFTCNARSPHLLPLMHGGKHA